jgi:hypothetical protein
LFRADTRHDEGKNLAIKDDSRIVVNTKQSVLTGHWDEEERVLGLLNPRLECNSMYKVACVQIFLGNDFLTCTKFTKGPLIKCNGRSLLSRFWR